MPVKKKLPPWRFRGVYARPPTAGHRARYEIVAIRDGRAKSFYARSREECEAKVIEIQKDIEASGGRRVKRPKVPDLPTTAGGAPKAPKGPSSDDQMAHIDILRAAMKRAMEISDFTAVSRLSKEIREYEAELATREEVAEKAAEPGIVDPAAMSDKIMQMGGKELCALAAELSKELWETEGVGLSLKTDGTSASAGAGQETEPSS